MTWSGRRLPLEFFIGSRRMGRSFAYSEDGYLYQAPVGYYTLRQAWDMAPGYANDRTPDLDRPLTRECLFCHASAARFVPGTLNRLLDPRELGGVTCDRCHGNGAAHAAKPGRGNIVNPARLAAPLRNSVCEQCHLSGAAKVSYPGKKLGDFRPGDRLADYLAVYLAESASGGVSVNGHAEALSRSRCRQGSDRLWCGTCHDPHKPVSEYRQKCLGCHSAGDCPAPGRDASDCTACHMPRARAYDGGHTMYTDHLISKRPSQNRARPGTPERLVPYFPGGTERELGLAYAQVAERYSAQHLYEKAWPLLRQGALAGARDPDLNAQLAYLLARDGRNDQAERLYREVLAADPENIAALMNLGTLLAQSGRKSAAKNLWQRVLAINPRQPGLRQLLEEP